jgi:hypothetical protein
MAYIDLFHSMEEVVLRIPLFSRSRQPILNFWERSNFKCSKPASRQWLKDIIFGFWPFGFWPETGRKFLWTFSSETASRAVCFKMGT